MTLVVPTDTLDIPIVQNPSITLVKTGTFNDANTNGEADPGETISYAFSITNSGNVTLTGVTLADTVGGVSISGGPSIATLAVGDTDATTFTGSYSITQVDIDAGQFFNTATTTGTDPNGAPVTDPDDETVDLPQAPAIELLKDGTFNDVIDGDGYADAGETISYTFTVTNTGNVTLTNVTLADTVGGVTISGGPIATLAVGAVDTTTFTGSYTLTQADVDAGTFTNTATVTGTDPNGDPVTDPDSHTEPLPGSIDIEKTGSFAAGVDGFAQPGELISYTFTVTNPGALSMTNVVVSDPLDGLSAITFTGGDADNDNQLDIDEIWTYQASYAVNQADIDAGAVSNTATVTGIDTADDPATATDPHTEPLPQDPSILLAKSGTFNDQSGDGFADAGETISYAFTVTNTGNVTLTGVTLADTVGGVSLLGGPIATLAVGAVDTTTFTGSYTLSQADVDAGTFTNTATVTGIDPNDEPVSDSDSDTQPLAQDSSIALEKTGTLNDDDGTTGVSAGDTISYAFSVTNTGNVTLTGVTLADTVGGVTLLGGPIATLAVGAVDSTTFTGSYTLSQADVDAGTFTNTATVTGIDPNDEPVSDPDSDTQPLAQDPSIALEKTGTLNDDDGTTGVSAGDTISYAFTVTNTGNVTLTGVTLADTVGGVSLLGGPIATLAVGAVDSTTFTGSYTLSQADVDAGTFTNTATVTGIDSNDEPVSDSDSDTQPLAQDSSIALEKTGTLNDDDGTTGVSAGDTISYAFTVTNTGNVTLTGVTLADTVGGVSLLGGPIATLAVGAVDSTTFTGSYTLSQADVDAGTFTNTATVTGIDSNDEPVSDPDSDTQPLAQDSSIALEKTGTLNDDDGTTGVSAGDTISYAFTVTNTGNVTLTGVTLADTVGGVSLLGGPIATLAVGAVDSTTFTGSYTLSQADVDAGTFTNTATVTGIDPNDEPVSDPDSDTQPLAQAPALTLEKSSTTTSVTTPGQVVPYSYLLTNTGNVTITALSVSDDNVGADPVCLVTTLAPTEATTCSASHTVTQAELDANGSPTAASGLLTNNAIATGTPAGGTFTDPTDDLDIPIVQSPAIRLVKTGTLNDDDGIPGVSAGDTISYAFSVTNTGNVTLTNVTLGDTVGGVTISGGPIASLAPGQLDATTFTGSYTLTQADVDAGTFFNRAWVWGRDPNGTLVRDPDADRQPLAQDTLHRAREDGHAQR